MKTIILAGGFGTRLSEKTDLIPKPMIEIGGSPILMHIMHHYASFGFNEFVLALGYKAKSIKEYFYHHHIDCNDLTIHMESGEISLHKRKNLPWTVHLVDTGLNTQTGGRLKRLQKWVGHETFMMTYGDGLSDVNIEELIAFHKSHGKLATVLSVRPPARFGELQYEGDRIKGFSEKPQTEAGWVNGGFFVLEPEVFHLLEGDQTIWEQAPLRTLAARGELVGLKHTGFWQPMDTLRECRYLNTLWEQGNPPWLRYAKEKLLV